MTSRLSRAAPLSPRLSAALGLLVATVAVGTAGYMLLSGLSFVDALYQTVTTLSTVGFRELAPFGTAEKLFTIVLVLLGVGVALYTLTLVVQEALEGDIRSRFYLRRTQLEIERLHDHYILCGFGRVGQEIARELHERRQGFVVIEQTPEEVEHARAFGYLVLEGDASEERVLLKAGLPVARSLLAASDSDAGNTYITLTARSINPRCFIVARCAHPLNEDKLRLAGADRVLSLYSMGGRRMVLMALQPLAADFMDTLATGRHGDLVLAELAVTEMTGLAGQSCGQLLAGTPNATLLGIRRVDGTLVVGPQRDERLRDGDIVIVLAEEPDIAALHSGTRTR
ncbi:MAG: NAD-binding protein [Dehalococcoidia bacterium]|nr:NAD-binding protein [Dehalococcoidia bacterium]